MMIYFQIIAAAAATAATAATVPLPLPLMRVYDTVIPYHIIISSLYYHVD